MDSKLIYSAAEHMNLIIEWNTNWVHFGTDNSIKYEMITKLIDEFFSEDQLYFVQSRSNSRIFQKIDFIDLYQGFLGKSNFQIWEINFNRCVQFEKIGVLKQGSVKSLNLS